MRILIISVNYPPAIGPRAIRWSAIGREWAQNGIGVDVVSLAKHRSPPFEIVDRVNIYRVGDATKWVAVQSTHRKNKAISEIGDKANKERSDSAAQKITTGIIRVARKLLWPDSAMFWILPAYRTAKKMIKENHYDAVLTVSWPVSPHVVGYMLRRTMSQKGISWIVDIGDPFSFNYFTPINNFRLHGPWNKLFERNLLENADWVTVTSDQTKAAYRNHYKDQEDKIFVIPPVVTFDPKRIRAQDKHSSSEMPAFHLIFAGSLRKVNRRPDSILALFSILQEGPLANRLHLHFYGDVTECSDSFEKTNHYLGDKIHLHGVVTKSEVDDAIRGASALVNLGNRSPYQLPSKIFDYLAANKPIINIASIDYDSSWEFLRSSTLAMNLLINDQDPLTIEKVSALERFILHPPKRISHEELEGLIKPYLPFQIASQYLQLIS